MITWSVPVTRLVDVGQQIRTDIATGHLPLGGRITIDELATRYKASHMPIREALRRLQGEGLVVLEPNRGARVRSMDRSFVENLFATRGTLEALLAGQAASHCRREHLAELRQIEAAREQHVVAADFPAALGANRRFHERINVLARNSQATAIIDQHWVLISALWHQYDYGAERFAGISSDHINLLRALEAQDSEAASVIMAGHVIKAKYDLLARMSLVRTASERDAVA